MFEGTPAQFWASLSTLRGLPGDTRIYCGHEYTQSNARFALSVDGGNAALRARAAEIDRLRSAGRPTVPSTLAEERGTNPFLRDRKSAVQGKSVSVRVDLGGRRIIQNKKTNRHIVKITKQTQTIT